MGLIRKTLAVGTVGVVRPSSKKQRNQKALIKEAKVANQLSALQLTAQLNAQAQAQQALAQAQAQTAMIQAQTQALQRAMTTPQPDLAVHSQPTQNAIESKPGPGWFPDPYGGNGTRLWDGTNWTDHVRPT